MLPVIALVGRPNGKSRCSISSPRPVMRSLRTTLDLPEIESTVKGAVMSSALWSLIRVVLPERRGIDAAMAAQSLAAIDEADVVLLMVDGRAGLQVGDQSLVRLLRERNKPFELVVNKIDGVGEDVAASDFHSLGVAKLHTIAATHNRGVRTMISEVMAPFGDTESETRGRIRHSRCGCRQAQCGKVDLVNRLLGEDRVVVFDQPGTTRDSVFIEYERHGHAHAN